ncbi:MAG TPA: phosphodiester glycosidase family protein [Steroidobacteraceae bacterium]|nr:phosphodiester glycosidase family protein [Steroidobacteraceae bacterium]
MRALLSIFLLFALIGESGHAAQPRFTAVPVDLSKQHLELFLRDDAGLPFHRFSKLERWLHDHGKQLLFAMNAGMFHADYSPVGLFVAQGKEAAPLNLSNGRGNFFLKPNGVFVVTNDGPKIVEASKYAEKTAEVMLATQSGPLLIENGVIHPAFRTDSRSRLIRNGVGISGNTVYFVVSDDPVTFYEFAVYFKSQLNCDNALYFDGVVSAIFAPELGRRQSRVNLGPIIAVVE